MRRRVWPALVAVCLLLSIATTAHGECAWVLWVRAAVADGHGAPTGPWTEWTTLGSVNVQRSRETLYPIWILGGEHRC